MTKAKTFLITGVSSGLGKAFAEGALKAGHNVIGTVRSDEAAVEFVSLTQGRAHAVVLDVTNFEAIPEIVAKSSRKVGPIDVLVNNAGYGHEGASRNRRCRICNANSTQTYLAPSQW